MWFRSALTLTYAEQASGKYYWESYEVKTKGFNSIRIPEPDWLDLLRALEFKKVRIFQIPEDIAKDLTPMLLREELRLWMWLKTPFREW